MIISREAAPPNHPRHHWSQPHGQSIPCMVAAHHAPRACFQPLHSLHAVLHPVAHHLHAVQQTANHHTTHSPGSPTYKATPLMYEATSFMHEPTPFMYEATPFIVDHVHQHPGCHAPDPPQPGPPDACLRSSLNSIPVTGLLGSYSKAHYRRIK